MGLTGNSHRVRVAVVVSLEHVYGRGVLAGASSYAHPNRPWQLRHFSLYRGNVAEMAREWGCQAVLGHFPTTSDLAPFRSLGVPVVNAAEWTVPGVPSVSVDNVAVGRQAARHLAARRAASFGFCGSLYLAFAAQRQQGFEEQLRSLGGTCAVFSDCDVLSVSRAAELAREEQALRHWLRELPKPAGLLAQNDQTALRLLEICAALGLAVPAEISLLGVDNDESICEFAFPRLSSIGNPAVRIGWEAAATLDRLWQGQPCPPLRLLPPGPVVERESTGLLGTTDPQLRLAVQRMYELASTGAGVKEVVGTLPISRRTFERRFRASFGRPPAQELERIRLDRALRLLRQPEVTIGEIAEKCGFPSLSGFSQCFRRAMGHTPSQWRQRHAAR